MAMTNTVHPPGGATALLAVVDPTASAMGWKFIPLMLLGSCLMLVVALLINNIQRQFPVFWWTPKEVGKTKKPDLECEMRVGKKTIEKPTEKVEMSSFKQIIILSPKRVLLPEGFRLEHEQAGILQILCGRLREGAFLEEEHFDTSFRSGSETTHVEDVSPG